MTRQQDLESRGWERRTTYDEPRLSEIAEMYEQMGFEVHIEPFDPAEESGCISCMRDHPELYKTIYTRRSAR
jgi:hypothetical protein